MEFLLNTILSAWQLVDIPGFDVEDLWEWRQSAPVCVCSLLVIAHSYLAGVTSLIDPFQPVVT